jgi:RNA polymerase sigma factor (sigma-70 family)
MTLALQGTPPTACSEHELVAAVRRGDDRAFEVLFSRYEQRITAYVAGMVGDHARAEDIRQDVFISALRRMRATQREIAFRPWIYEIAKNACIDEFRRARRAAEVVFEEADGSAGAAPTVFVHAPAPDAAIESKQRLDDLCGAFGGLSENHHRVLVLRELEGLSYREIGERLGMTRAMVESTLFRARRRLSEEYEELTSGRRCVHVQSLIAGDDERPLTSLGVRERRQFARHLAHCDPCRHRARAGGVDESLFAPRRRIARIAALLPLPFLRWRRGGSRDDAIAQSGSHSIAVAQSLQNVARVIDPGGPSTALGRAAATAAAIALAGVGGGIGIGVSAGRGHGRRSAPAVSHPASAPTAGRSARTTPLNRSASVNVGAGGARAGARTRGPQDPSNSSAGVEPGMRSTTNAPTTTQSTSGTDPARGATQAARGASGLTGAPSASRVPGSGATNGANVSVPSVSAPAPTSATSSPQLPSVPSKGAPRLPTPSPAGVPSATAPTPPSVPSTVASAPATVTKTAAQVVQSLPSPSAAGPPVSPPSGG